MSKDQDKVQQTKPSKPKGRPRRWLWFVAGVATTLATALGGTAIMASSWAGQSGWYRHAGYHHWGHHGGGMRDPEMARERAAFAVDRILSKVDATEEQKVQVNERVSVAIDDLFALSDQHRQNREAFVTTLISPNVDRDALDSIRQAELQLADQASTQVVDALAQIAEVLTPEQRSQLAEMSQKFRH